MTDKVDTNENVAGDRKLSLKTVPRSLWRALLHISLVLIAIFGGYEVIERMWLQGLSMETLHYLHITRGLVASLVVAGILIRVLLKSSPKLLRSQTISELGNEDAVLEQDDPTHLFARWFVKMRWIAIMGIALAIFFSVELFDLLPDKVAAPLIVTLALIFVLNLGYATLVNRIKAGNRFIAFQAYGDLIVLVILLHFSGGVENPVSLVMIFHVIIGGILLSRKHCYAVASAGSVLFGLLILLEVTGTIEHYTLEIFPHEADHGNLVHAAHQPLYVLTRWGVHSSILFLTAYFVTSLAEQMRRNDKRFREMAHKALADHQLLEQALATTQTGLRVLNRDLTPRWANDRWQEWFGTRDGLLCERASGALGSQEISELFREKRVRVSEINGQGQSPCDAEGRGRNARPCYQVTTAPIWGNNGKVSQVVELAQDITDQKEAQAQMMRAGRLAAVGELAGRIAHEVNNPIGIISAKAKLLLSDERRHLSNKAVEEVEKMVDLANRVAGIAQGLLSYCRPVTTSRAKLDIRSPLWKSLTMVKEHAGKQGVEIEQSLSASLPPIQANSNELEQLFLNLLLNALDAMPQGGTLRVQAEVGGGNEGSGAGVTITVEDTGTGIPEDVREWIFEPFFSTKGAGHGTGLGLSICQGVAQSHGGRLEFESEAGRGTRFLLTLPVYPPNND